MYKLTIDEIKRILEWYKVASMAGQTEGDDYMLATGLNDLIKDFE